MRLSGVVCCMLHFVAAKNDAVVCCVLFVDYCLLLMLQRVVCWLVLIDIGGLVCCCLQIAAVVGIVVGCWLVFAVVVVVAVSVLLVVC